jgi:hypothetical protein
VIFGKLAPSKLSREEPAVFHGELALDLELELGSLRRISVPARGDKALDGRPLYEHLTEAPKTGIEELIEDEGFPLFDVGFGMLSAAIALFEFVPQKQRHEIAEALRTGATKLEAVEGEPTEGPWATIP